MKASNLIQRLAQSISSQGDQDVVFVNQKGEIIFDRFCVGYSVKGNIKVYLTKRESV